MRCPMHMKHVNAVLITPVYWYFHCDFEQNIALFCAISEFVLLLLFADASCLTVAIQKIVFFLQGGDTGREVTVETVVEVYPIPNRVEGLGSVVSSPGGLGLPDSGAEPQTKTVFGRFMRNFVPF